MYPGDLYLALLVQTCVVSANQAKYRKNVFGFRLIEKTIHHFVS